MHSKCIDWGPKPFKVYHGWLMNKDYHKLVRDYWSESQPKGWGGLVLSFKFKNNNEFLVLVSQKF